MRTKPTARRNSIAIQYAVPRRGVPAAAALRKWARSAAPAGDITLRIVGSREGRLLNQRFRKRARATNVLSFAYGPGGDLVLFHPGSARQAPAQDKKLP